MLLLAQNVTLRVVLRSSQIAPNPQINDLGLIRIAVITHGILRFIIKGTRHEHSVSQPTL